MLIAVSHGRQETQPREASHELEETHLIKARMVNAQTALS